MRAHLGEGGGRCDDSAVGAALAAMLAAAARSQAEASALRCVPAPERLMLPGTSPSELERRPEWLIVPVTGIVRMLEGPL